MSTHAARTEAPGSPAPKRPLHDVYDELARIAWGEADILRWHDRDMRRINQDLHPDEEPIGAMLPEFAERHRNLERIAQSLEHARDMVLKQQDAARARARNARK